MVMDDDSCVLLLKQCTKELEFLDSNILKTLLYGCLPIIPDDIDEILKVRLQDLHGLNKTTGFRIEILELGISCLLTFVRQNWTGPVLKTSIIDCLTKNLSTGSTDKDASDYSHHLRSALAIDGITVYELADDYILLLIAKTILIDCRSYITDLWSLNWWTLRCLLCYQDVLEEKSPTLSSLLNEIAAQEYNSVTSVHDSMLFDILWRLELGYAHLKFYDFNKAKTAFNYSVVKTGLEVNLSGALGKRTKFQQDYTSQIFLKVVSTVEDIITIPSEYALPGDQLPKDLLLEDEVRLNSVAYKEQSEINIPDLNSVQLATILALFKVKQESGAYYELVDEELLAYLSCVLSQPKSWCLHTSALVARCRLEKRQRRTVERSMTQLQSLEQALTSECTSFYKKLPLFFCSALPPKWIMQKELANILVSLGAVSSALDIYMRLKMWMEVIQCYNMMNRRQKAAEVIREQLAVRETPVLWCHLGDATDDITFYEKAWELSGHKSSLAQKSIAMFYFRKKKYLESLPYFEQSLELNSVQMSIWFSYGYAAMQVEEWEKMAKAYRHCCGLDTDNCEAWNNLSHAYIKLQQKRRAFSTLQEAIRCNYEDWRIWENYMLVSTDVGCFDEVLQAFNRLAELKEKYCDVEVLSIVSKAVIEGTLDESGKSATVLRPKLIQVFGRLAAQVCQHSKVYYLYAITCASTNDSTVENQEKVCSLLQKSFKFLSSKPNWEKDLACLEEMCELCSRIDSEFAKWSQIACDQEQQILSSRKLLIQGAVVKVKRYEESCINPLPEKTITLINQLKNLSI